MLELMLANPVWTTLIYLLAGGFCVGFVFDDAYMARGTAAEERRNRVLIFVFTLLFWPVVLAIFVGTAVREFKP